MAAAFLEPLRRAAVMALARAPVVIVLCVAAAILSKRQPGFFLFVAALAHLLLAIAFAFQGLLAETRKHGELAMTAYVRALSNQLISATLAVGHVVLQRTASFA